MFKLKRLEISGFKSFADYTEIVFTGNGITAVVGPNGCGKSNVSDAISWVLGEQRAKSLRGAEMKDVIFQGSRNRKPSGMAEVVLHLTREGDAFDNDEAELEDIDETLSAIDEKAVDVDALEAEAAGEDLEPEIVSNPEEIVNDESLTETGSELELAAQVGSVQTVGRTIKTKRHWRPRSFALEFAPGEAVSVTRRLYLSGESEYQLNGKTCRLRDIQDLFAGTGLSGSHYAIIEQGRIGQILSAKPGDRRGLIEEAAGISKFRTRQRAAESRLESAKTNLGRISDIVSEIDKQANSLRRQAAKTRRFLELQEDYRVLLRMLFAAEGRHYSGLINDLSENLKKASDAEKDLADKVASTEISVRETTGKARQAEELLAEIRKNHSDNALERDRAEREHRYQSQQIVDLGQRIDAIKQEISSATERLELADAEFLRLSEDESHESGEAEAAEKVLLEAEGLFASKLADVRRIESELEESRAELLKHTAALERFAESERQLKFNLERQTERIEGLERERIRAGETKKEHIAEAERLAKELVAEKEKFEILKTEKQAIAAETASAREVLAASEAQMNSLRDEHSRSKHRLETLHELEEKRAVYAPEVQKLFAAKNEIGVDFTGVLADFMNVLPEAERAVESLFGRFLQTVIVADEKAAAGISSWLDKGNIGGISTFSFNGNIAAGSSNANLDNGSAQIADLLGISNELKNALSTVFPREMSARLVDDLYAETSANGELLVNKEGDMLVGGKLFISGKQPVEEKNASLLAFKRELKKLEKTVDKLEVGLAEAQKQVAADREKVQQKEEKIVDLQSVIIKIERGLDALEMQERTSKQDIERAERHLNVVNGEAAQVAAEAEDIKKRIDESITNTLTANQHVAESRTRLESISAELLKARELSEAESESVSKKRTMAATSGERRRSVQSALRRVENERKELAARISSLGNDREQTHKRIIELEAAVSIISERLGSVDNEIETEQTELKESLQALQNARSISDETSVKLAELNQLAAEALNARAAIEINKAEAVTELKNISENCSQELNIELNELVESIDIPDDFILETARKDAGRLRERLDGFGAINMLAVDELAEADERLLFLTSQRQDIIDSISSAEEALREIKERSRERFKKAFEAINENFKEFFFALFGGGRGEMTLLEADDILEAGIEVVAQPPGKRLQNILLLSGGEKAMTAIALVMAIFKYRPSPFCLLDEVDAPLDEANVGRFVDKIGEMSENTQFIVITHNKRTMESAKALYGVTMQEAGVSRVVSVKFE